MNKEETKEYHKEWYLNKKEDPIWIEKKKKLGKDYYQKIKNNPNQIKKYREMTKRWRSTVEGIYGSLKNRGRKDFNLSKKEFIDWYNKQKKKCSYCSLTLEEIRKLPAPYDRKNGLLKYSIDRKDSNLGYSIENIVLSCFTCNTIKNNFLSFEEMKKIGKEIIEPKLRKLLN